MEVSHVELDDVHVTHAVLCAVVAHLEDLPTIAVLRQTCARARDAVSDAVVSLRVTVHPSGAAAWRLKNVRTLVCAPGSLSHGPIRDIHIGFDHLREIAFHRDINVLDYEPPPGVTVTTPVWCTARGRAPRYPERFAKLCAIASAPLTPDDARAIEHAWCVMFSMIPLGSMPKPRACAVLEVAAPISFAEAAPSLRAIAEGQTFTYVRVLLRNAFDSMHALAEIVRVAHSVFCAYVDRAAPIPWAHDRRPEVLFAETDKDVDVLASAFGHGPSPPRVCTSQTFFNTFDENDERHRIVMWASAHL